jgi:hypothetical protein
MMHYWRKGPLPACVDDLVTIGKLRSKNASSIAQALLTEFFTMSGDGLYHQKRQDKEIARWQQKRVNAVERAKKGAAKRWGDASSIPEALLTECPLPLPSPLPLSSPTSKAKTKGLLLPAVIRLPAVGGKEYAVTKDQVQHWNELYPAVDVMRASEDGWMAGGFGFSPEDYGGNGPVRAELAWKSAGQGAAESKWRIQ